jgi:hypothetical protein
VSYAPVWTGSGSYSLPGRFTSSVNWAYTNGLSGFAYLSATFLPSPQVPAPSSWLHVNDVAVTEGNSGTKAVTFTVTRSGAVAGAASLKWNTVDGTAKAGSDYVAVPVTPLNFIAGETSKTVSVTVNGDVFDEAHEKFSVRLTSAAGATIADEYGTATVEDDEDSYLAIDDVAVREGDSSTSVPFRIFRTGSTSGSASVRWATVATGSASAGADYVAVASTPLTFAPGESAKTVSVPLIGDALDEANETFRVQLSSPLGAVLADDSATATIEDDDATYLSVDDVTLTEGNVAQVANVTIRRSGKTSAASTVQLSTANETATGPDDYGAVPPTAVSFAGGETTKTVPVTVNGDTVDEANESFLVKLSIATGASISDDVAMITIVDDDGAITPGPATFLTVNDVSVLEANSGTTPATFRISRYGTTTGTSTVSWSTVNSSAVSGSDYVAEPATTVAFAAGETLKTVTVNVIGDNEDEANETFQVRLASPTGAVLSDSTGVATVEDNEATFLRVDDTSVVEGHSGTRTATFNVRRSGSTAGTSTLTWRTADNTARAGEDYVAVQSKQLTFGPGKTTEALSVTVNGDGRDEDAENMNVWLGSPAGATLADSLGRITIDDDDATYLAVNDVAVVEGEAGTTAANFTITRSGGTAATSTVEWKTVTSTAYATAGTDYVAVAADTVTFAPTETTKTVSVTVNGDPEAEPHERIGVALQRPSGAFVSDDLGIATIVADETSLVVNDVRLPGIADGTTLAALFTITRSGPLTATSSVQYATANGTATAGDDYTALPLTSVTFAPGETLKRVPVMINGTRDAGPDDNFFLRLSSPVGAVIVDGEGEARLHEQSNAANCGADCA